jgi:hypothetical protein
MGQKDVVGLGILTGVLIVSVSGPLIIIFQLVQLIRADWNHTNLLLLLTNMYVFIYLPSSTYSF